MGGTSEKTINVTVKVWRQRNTNEKGNFETINMKKDLSRSLILNEVLHILKLQHNITIQKSWEILEENLQRNPTILRKWLAIKTPIGIKTSPTNFQVGSNRNMKKLLSIAKKIKNKDKNVHKLNAFTTVLLPNTQNHNSLVIE